MDAETTPPAPAPAPNESHYHSKKDRVFVRGLQVEEALWLDEYDASDHTPLLVRLRDEPRA